MTVASVAPEREAIHRLETGGILVGDRVDIELDVQGVRAAAQSAV
ncbi:hypothetical protein AKJ09_00500 [Labilithrix luteola]|uniref:Uncharacterized protein n=1 Tax=Labilithrix luteola TaxID=1391654 RepID=A0A0K1PKC1_9BACT|nr:hypothetical protein [Labilithrix luteola]AKU93836.1 hypothetical protein AKJ09_00500 [Labilithrix luteola]